MEDQSSIIMTESPDHPGRSSKAGLPPGTLLHVGERRTTRAKITLMNYTSAHFQDAAFDSLEEYKGFKPLKGNRWINVDGIHDDKVIRWLGEEFDLHPLLLEDIMNTRQPPKTDKYEKCVFLTLKMLGVNKEKAVVEAEHISLVLGGDFLISFQEEPGDVFDFLRQRLRETGSTIRQKGIDYLFYRLVDTIVDYYFHVIEFLGNRLETLDETVMDVPSESIIREIQNLKKQLILMRRAVVPMRENIRSLNKEPAGGIIEPLTMRYLGDVYDHIVQIIETVETYRELLSSNLEIYMNSVNLRMNQVMKTLTIITTIFIPLSFLAGIYGMNFQNMPELGWKYGYSLVWSVMLAVVIMMIRYFRKRKWM
jgi:magnesium transporter